MTAPPGMSSESAARLAVICHARHALEPADEAGLGKAHRQGVYTGIPSQDGAPTIIIRWRYTYIYIYTWNPNDLYF